MADHIYQITETLQKTVPIAILSVGTIGNILSFTVLTRPKTRRYSTAVFLIALTIVDFIAMWSGLIRIILEGYMGIDIRNIGTGLCKLHIFLIYASTHASSWLIVGVTVERIVCVWMPLKMRQVRSQKLALLVCGVILLTVSVINSHLLVGFELSVYDDGNILNSTELICQPPQNTYGIFIDKVWPWIDMTLLFLLPFGIIIIGNMLIIVRVRMSRAMRRDSCPDTSRRALDSNALYFLTALLLTLNIVFMVCVAPITVYIIGQYTWWPSGNLLTEKELAMNGLWWVIVNIMVYLNYAVNFILYLACGPMFRDDMKEIFSFVCLRPRQHKHCVVRSVSSGSCSMSAYNLSDISLSQSG